MEGGVRTAGHQKVPKGKEKFKAYFEKGNKQIKGAFVHLSRDFQHCVMKVQIRQENEFTSGSTQESEWRKFRFVFFLFFLLFLDILIVTAKITLRTLLDKVS